ncbi:ATP phosphoribosyltransferase [Nesterenkonia sp. LB17]|uniref:ATP phosphoribosyltransferase n=1 Tax=unclassified Nesterenkonia TaxID=2629769 RepID=UPI001F4CF194|nr:MULTISPECIES: ATP phosphoribosyltransferase [unclassified Nesterenkonia]MCH8559504.1 ATP phosphoribosyltransferase [Nesterenkonia sp. DZ6]MCH8561681.1 ATP phosphoribosyltransferase [Nesterenkonia sp. YGD6]MCH8564804.1 ATP phosphoribosyltransferase [Nesterenkonia sp. LB17]MCH8570420.1 ATP phosphoribosyltransferase [Nesterenkonia sp. AY15]
MLRIAVPNKGALSEAAMEMLSEAGYVQRRDRRELVMLDEENGVEFFYLRPRDIAVYVGAGTLDVGLTGRDLFQDARVDHGAEEVLGLGFGKSTFRLAGPAGRFTSAADLAGTRVATSYDGLLAQWFQDQGVPDVEVVHLDGAVETSVRLGVADAIADVVETGNTLKAAGMETFGEPIMRSEAILISGRDQHPEGLDRLIRRLQGVMVAAQYVMMDYDVHRDLLPAAAAITPGLESPTISPLADENWVAVRSMVPAKKTNQLMDELYELGARAILVSSIHACRI